MFIAGFSKQCWLSGLPEAQYTNDTGSTTHTHNNLISLDCLQQYKLKIQFNPFQLNQMSNEMFNRYLNVVRFSQ